MKRLCSTAVLASVLFLSGCGAMVTFQTDFNQGTEITSGTVSIVRLTVISDNNGTSVQVTVVTLVQLGSPQTLTFCGTQVNQFPMNTAVTARFTPGTTCSTLVAVKVIG